MINWHRLFGLTLGDYLFDTPFSVELEKDLARQRQLVDVVIIRGDPDARLPEPCAGFGNLCAHNLLTYKSPEDSLDAWTLEELIGHYVNYRKVFAPGCRDGDFGLYAVATRYPRRLFEQVLPVMVEPGVYRIGVLSRTIDVIVPRQVEASPRNALWSLFSADPERVQTGLRTYRWRDPEHIPLILWFAKRFRNVEVSMPYTLDDFYREHAHDILRMMPRDALMLAAEELLDSLPVEERLRGLPPEERLRGLSAEELAAMQRLLAERTGA